MLPFRSQELARLRWLLLCLCLFSLSAGASDTGRAPLKVDIEGLSGALLSNVQAWLGIDQPGPLQRLKGLIEGPSRTADQSELQVQRFYRDAPPRIRKALEALGYYNPSIQPSLKKQPHGWLIRFRIDPGPPTRVSAAHIRIQGSGQSLPALRKWRQDFPLQTGQILLSSAWDQAKQQGLSLAHDHGYLDAHYSTHKIVVDRATHSAELDLVMISGTRYRFGKVRFEQKPSILSDSLLQRYVTFQANDPYNQEALGDLEANLIKSGYFADVQVNQGKHQGQVVPIDVQLTPAKRYSLSAGIGYGTDTGPRTQLTWRDRRVNRQGHTLTASLKLSTLLQGAVLNYGIPLANPVQDSLNLGASVQRQNTKVSLSTIAQLSATWTRKMGNGWTRKLYTALNGERSEIANQTTKSLYLVPGVDFSRTVIDGDPLTPKRGWHLDLDIKTGVPLSNSPPFLQTLLKAKWIDTLGNSGIRVLLHGALGATLVNNFDKLPVSDRFFTGGANSVRGFRYDTVGARDSNGNVIGGTYLAVGGVELQFPVAKHWSVGIFSDAGNVGNSLTSIRPAITAGAGVQWDSPAGPIRVYLARRLVGQGDTFPLVISMGPDL